MTPEEFMNMTPAEREEYTRKGLESINRWQAAGCPCELSEWAEKEEQGNK